MLKVLRDVNGLFLSLNLFSFIHCWIGLEFFNYSAVILC